jgi:MFS family permease
MNKISSTSGARGKPVIILYAATVFFYWASLYVYVPTLPAYARTVTDNLALVGVVLSMYGLWQAIIRLPLGIAADWLGWRKPFIVLGLGLSAAGAWLMGSAADVNGLIVGRAVTGLAAGTWVPLVVVFSSLFPPEETIRATALLTLIGTVARILATLTNGPLNALSGGYGLAFSVAMGIAALAVLVVLPTPETRYPPKRPSVGGIARLIVRRDVLLPSLLNTVGQYINWGVSFGFVPLLAKELGAGDVVLSFLTTLHLIFYTIGNLATTTVIRYMGTRRLLYWSFVSLAAGTVGAALAPSVPILLAVQGFLGLGIGVGYPLLMGMSIQNVPGPERSTATGLHQAVYAIGMFTGPWLSGILADALGIRPMFWITAAACLPLGLIGTAATRTQPK